MQKMSGGNLFMKKTIATLLAVLFLFTALPVSASTEKYNEPWLSDYYENHGFMPITVGETMQLAPIMAWFDGEDEIYPVGNRTWTSRDPDIVSVTGNGVATALQTGTAKISVTFHTNRDERVTETVYLTATEGAVSVAPAYSLRIAIKTVVNVKELFFPGVKGGTFQWDVKDSFLATVDQNGLLTAVEAGSCGIVATHTDENGIATVKNISLEVEAEHHWPQNKLKTTLAPGETIDLIRAVFPDETEVALRFYTCRSDNSHVAAIGDDQSVTAKDAGACGVTITKTFQGEERVRQTVQIVVSD
jgi:hypothetical protein